MKVEATRPRSFEPVEVRITLEAPEEVQAALAFFGGLSFGSVQRTMSGSKRAGASAVIADELTRQLYCRIAKAMGTD